MAVRSLSKIACAHSHLWHPFCPHQPLSSKVTNVFFLALGVVVGCMVYRAIRRSFVVAPPLPKPPVEIDRDIPPFLTTSIVLSSLTIQSEGDISKLPQIVGLSIDTLERRARPASETAQGFMENKDSLLDVIRKNWQQAKKAGIPHAEIADHLRHLVETARKSPGKLIRYNFKKSDPENMPAFLVVVRVKNDNFDTDIFRPLVAKKEVGASNEEALIINPSVHNKYIRWTPIRERYIREFGFYSVGMDFETVLQVLQGK